MPISRNYLERLALDHNFCVQYDHGSVKVLDSTGIEFYSASKGQKVAGAIEAINQRLQGVLNVPTPGYRLPVTRTTHTPFSGDGAVLWERNYDQEILDEIPVRDRLNSCRLLQMRSDGGLLEAAIREIIGSVLASEDGDDRGWTFAATIDREGKIPVKKDVAKLLDSLYDRVIGGSSLYAGLHRSLWLGDAFASIGIEPDKKGFRIARLKWLPTFEIFRVEREFLEDGKLKTDIYFEQRSYLSDEKAIQIPYMGMLHIRHDFSGGLYGRALFAGESCYNYWLSLKEAEEDLRKASRNVAIKPLIHRFSERYSPSAKEEYRNEIERKRYRDGAITDFFITGSDSEISTISGNGSDLTGLIAAIEYWRKAIATHARIPSYLLNVEALGARDIAQQPALAYARLLNSIRSELTDAIDHLCRLELMLHDIDPDLPENRWRVVFPEITINAYSDANAGENPMFKDPEAAPEDTELQGDESIETTNEEPNP